MIKLFRASITSAALGWAWKNRSTITSKISELRSKPEPPQNPAEGYASVIGDEALVDPDVVQ